VPQLDEEVQGRKLEYEAFRTRTSTASVQMHAVDVAKALAEDGRFFINFFHGENLDFDIPDFHLKSWDLLTFLNVLYVVLALPRGHAKTTLAKLAVVYYLLFTDFHFAVYIGSTHTAAVEACEDIINFLACDNARSVFGELDFEVNQPRTGFYKFHITLPHILDRDGRPLRKFCILKAHGAGMKVRGMNVDNERPEIAVLDDIEDDENVATPLLMKKLKTWFFGAFLKAMSKKRHKVIFLGNLISSSGLLAQLLKSKRWYSMRYGCLLSDGTPLWPELWPIEAIKADFIEYQENHMIGRWFAEMMNIPMADSSPLLAEEDIHYRPLMVPGQQEFAFITVDPAISKKSWADSTAIVVHAYRDGIWQIADHVTGKIDPDVMFDYIVAMCMKWNCRVVGIEMAAFQKALKFLFDILMHVKQFQFTVIELPHGNVRKTDRLAVFVSAMKKKVYALNAGDFAVTEQLLKYDPTKEVNEDDLIDACSTGPVMVENYMNFIINDYGRDDHPGEVQSDLESQEV
jgi:hypothetical protein